MWLLPAFGRVSRIALRAFYRFQLSGSRVPADGPVLLVANHPNSLLDPAAVVAVAGRPVRFLAKAPLFSDRQVGWLVRGAGAIPVYRRADDPALLERNDQTFQAAFEALWAGAAIGIFPEGVSHSEPALQPLRTGAARIALGAAARDGRALTIVPVGLSFRDKATFRSEALAVLGAPIRWDDLAAIGAEPEAVRELTRRIEEGLRNVTVNLERWEDAPLVEHAEEIYLAERDTTVDAEGRVRGLREVSETLARLRGSSREDWKPIAAELRRHARVLGRLGIRPHQLAQPGPAEVLRWTARQVPVLLALPLALLAALLWLPPYRLTGALAGRAAPPVDIVATHKVLTGAVLHLAWLALLTLLAGVVVGRAAALAVAVALPLLGALALWTHGRWTAAEGAAQRYLVRGRRPELLRELRERQRRIADRLEGLRSPLHAL
jgi:glycerol-3-phosphate O-acyltransferase/dihydroxyacetone phosphate acyltransferase